MANVLEVNKVADMVADMEVDKVADMVADMEVDKVADMVVDEAGYLFLLSKHEKRISNFSFYSPIRYKNFKFLFLLSNSI